MANPDALMQFFTSYLGINPSTGCTNSCGYCILQKDIPASKKIVEKYPAKFTLKKILDDARVGKNNPIAFYNLSDPFLRDNVKNLMDILEGMENTCRENIAVLITKLNPDRTAPDQHVLDRLARMVHIRPVLMVTYANLPKIVEPTSKSGRLELMAKAKALRIPVVQYARPVWEGWTPRDKIREMAGETANIVDAVALDGLLVTDGMKTALVKRGAAVPSWGNEKGRYLKSAYRNFVAEEYKKKNPHLPIFMNSSCAISFAAGIPNYMGYYPRFSIIDKEGYCQRPCNPAQRERCATAKPSIIMYDETGIEDLAERERVRLLRKGEEAKVKQWLDGFGIKRVMFHIGDGNITVFADMSEQEVRWMRQHTGMFIYSARHFGRVGYRPGIREFMMGR